ncbi:ParB/RepB/Spo0J family partition protein [Tranquillimonas alkanivorans]|uniref:ParB-like nuclease domain-containing protein n=1 Tax=Tranquillimonas alkanivorans TaxID=441119 RepID=A0A1I5WBZ4_9RHOB|nr:ParB N-terminal domain-containing protein [Tranquillimonas alkanivorans]SFQ17219.1 ParB-like nuclease domain-containing protein [Tranquillimonas alkanivorans]
MKARKHQAPATLPPIEDDVMEAQPVDTMASLDSANQAELSVAAAKKIRGRAKEDVLEGRAIIEIDPAQLFDLVGTDRVSLSDSAAAQDPDVEDLKKSIGENGQQNPIIVRPKDPRWSPRSDDPTNVEGVEFELLAGRRRRLAVAQLNSNLEPNQRLRLRAQIAYIAPDASEAERRLHALKHRYVENEARKDLTPFQKAVSGGMLIAEYEATGTQAQDIEAALGITHPTRRLWRQVFDRQDDVRGHFAGREPSHAELKDFVEGRLGKPAAASAPVAKTKGERGFYTVKPAAKRGKVAVQLKVTLDEEQDAELIEMLKGAIGEVRA